MITDAVGTHAQRFPRWACPGANLTDHTVVKSGSTTTSPIERSLYSPGAASLREFGSNGSLKTPRPSVRSSSRKPPSVADEMVP